MRSGNTTPLCAIEDWSGAGFHTKQPLNVGQPIVSQVVSSPNNQSCLDPSLLDSAHEAREAVCVSSSQNPLLGEATPHSERESSNGEGQPQQRRAHTQCLPEWSVSGPREQWAGMANRQVRARFYCHGLEVIFGGGDTSKAAPPGIEPVNPLWSFRFLLMQTHVGYRLA